MRASERFPRGHRRKKGQRLDAFIEAMMTRKTTEEAAVAAGISPATAYRWLQDPLIIERLAAARRDSMARCMSRLQANATRAADNLDKLQQSAESEAVRLGASRATLEFAFKTTELTDVIERLDALERTVKSQAFTPAQPKVAVTFEHAKDGKGNPNGKSSKTPFGGTGSSHEQ